MEIQGAFLKSHGTSKMENDNRLQKGLARAPPPRRRDAGLWEEESRMDGHLHESLEWGVG